MWLPTTPSPSPALLPAVLVGGMWPFPRGFSGCDSMAFLRWTLTYSPVMLPFWSRIETSWTSPPALACWQWLKTSLETTGTAAKLSWTYLLLTELMYIPLMSLVRPIELQDSQFICCMKYWNQHKSAFSLLDFVLPATVKAEIATETHLWILQTPF